MTARSARGSGMLPSFGPLYYLAGLPWFFRRLKMEDGSAERVRKAAERGPIVYVLHTLSHVDWLALNRVLVDRRLPLPALTTDLDPTRWRSLGDLLGGGSKVPPPTDLPSTVCGGQAACIFLARPWDPLALVVRREDPDPLPELLRGQAGCTRPIQLLPSVVVWNRAPDRVATEVGRFLIGTQERPGVVGKLYDLAQSSGDAVVQVGEPVDLPTFLAAYTGRSERERNKLLRLGLRQHLAREARVVRGPRARPFEWVARQVLESRDVQELIVREAQTGGTDVAKVRRRVVKTFRHIAARFSFPMVRLAGALCRLIWNRVFSGIDVRREDLERIRAALRSGTPVLVPCHRSHLDYLLISSLLFEQDIVIPHIVAGENLSFWPIGPIIRRCGAFFIKRSFAGDRIFPTVFARYLRELVRMEVPVEFFIEGGRSRTGKLLPPKTGVLSMVLDAAAEAREGRQVSFLPVYVGYEQIAEERAYARELGGAKKAKEDMGQVVKATRVLGQRYGKVYLRVAPPLLFDEVTSAEGWRTAPKARREEILLSLGERILHRINAEAVALPTALVALAVLAHPRKGLRHTELRDRVERLRSFLAAAGVHEGGGVAHVEGILAEATERFLRGKLLTAFDETDGRVYSIVPERRVTLEYYKNAVIHAFVPAAYYAAAVRALRSDVVDREAVSRLFGVQQLLLRYEFILDPEADGAELERRAVVALVAYGALVERDGGLHVLDRGRVVEIANLTANFLESYLLLLRAAKERPAPLRQLPQVAIGLGQTLLACDEITRPESVNLQNLQNAAKALREDGVLRGEAGKAEVVAEAWDATMADLRLLLGNDDARSG